MPMKGAKDINGTLVPLPGKGPEQRYDEFQGTTIVVDLDEVDRTTEEFEGSDWLEQRLADGLSWGWDLEWVPDRRKEADNPIALMQFSDENTALLIRTHRSRQWLPSVIIRALESENSKKIGVGYDGADKQKMDISFKLQPNGIIDLCSIAEQKGLSERGLKSMCDYFGLRPRKDTRVARSNWACKKLSADQIQYAAEDAYFTYILLEKLLYLPDPTEDNQISNTPSGSTVELQPGWSDQGIVRKHDGLWCSLCERGPMTVAMVVLRHMEGTKHRKKYEQKKTKDYNSAYELPQNYVDQGIFAGTGQNDVPVGQFKCGLCDAGPFNTLEVVESHIASKRHQRAANPDPEPVPEEKGKEKEKEKEKDKESKKEKEKRRRAEIREMCSSDEEEKGDPHAHMIWNVPDYVLIEDDKLMCSLCQASANAVLPMFMHLGGDKHARKCRTLRQDEVIYIKERERMESLYTGQPVIRSGFRIPRKGDEPYDWRPKEARKPKKTNPLAVLQPLIAGWEEHVDESTGYLFYYNTDTNETTWIRPTPATQPSDGSRLPPGWQEIWNEEADQPYYCDPQSGRSQWHPPNAYIHADWTRLTDKENLAYWSSALLNVAFYEGDAKWQRLLDANDQIYWSNGKTRFFEKNPYEGLDLH